jgi:predicted nucleotidyltransferase
MLLLVHNHRNDIAALCRRFNVKRLEVFGSAARGTDFNPDRSDVDFLVSFDPDSPEPDLRAYFDLRQLLAGLLGRPVDLVMAGAVRNPYLRAEIDRSKQLLYAS